MAPQQRRYDRTLRFRADEATSRKIEECCRAEAERGQIGEGRSGAIRNAIDLYHEWIVQGYTIYAEDDPRGVGKTLDL